MASKRSRSKTTKLEQPKIRQRLLALVIMGWALLGAGLTVYSVSESNRDSQWVVALAGVVGVLAAVGAASLAQRGRYRVCGYLLVVSAVIPTGMAYVPNVLALVGGLALVYVASRQSER